MLSRNTSVILFNTLLETCFVQQQSQIKVEASFYNNIMVSGPLLNYLHMLVNLRTFLNWVKKLEWSRNLPISSEIVITVLSWFQKSWEHVFKICLSLALVAVQVGRSQGGQHEYVLQDPGGRTELPEHSTQGDRWQRSQQ